jgi:hypothetical protein
MLFGDGTRTVTLRSLILINAVTRQVDFGPKALVRKIHEKHLESAEQVREKLWKAANMTNAEHCD